MNCETKNVARVECVAVRSPVARQPAGTARLVFSKVGRMLHAHRLGELRRGMIGRATSLTA